MKFRQHANTHINILTNIAILSNVGLIGSSTATGKNSSDQCTDTPAAYLEINNLTRYLDGRGCLLIVPHNTSFFGQFCVPELVPPYSMSAVLNDEPVVAVTIDGCCHMDAFVTSPLSLLRMLYVEEEGCRRKGERSCILQTREDLESAYSKQPSSYPTSFRWIVLCVIISRALISL